MNSMGIVHSIAGGLGIFALCSCPAPSPYRVNWTVTQMPREKKQSPDALFKELRREFDSIQFLSKQGEAILAKGTFGNTCSIEVKSGLIQIMEYRYSGADKDREFRQFMDRLKLLAERNGATVKVKRAPAWSITGM